MPSPIAEPQPSETERRRMRAEESSDVTLSVEAQLAAYNARDIDAFMRHRGDDREYPGFPGTLLARGAKEDP